MYIQTTDHHIEYINLMTYDRTSGSKVGVRPEKAKSTFDFIPDSLCEGATLVDITKPLERSCHDSKNR